MCVTDTGSGRRQEPLLGFNIPKECVFQERIKCVCSCFYIVQHYIYCMYHCLLYVACDAWPVLLSGRPWTLV